MITPELISYIKLSIEKGVSAETIKHDLIGAGWSDIDIVQAFISVNSSVSNIPTPPISMNNFSNLNSNYQTGSVATKSKKKSLLYFTIFIVIILLGAGVFYAYTQKINPFSSLKDQWINLTQTKIDEVPADAFQNNEISQPIATEDPDTFEKLEDSNVSEPAPAPAPDTDPVQKNQEINASIMDNLHSIRVGAGLYFKTHKKSYGKIINNNCASISGSLFADKSLVLSIKNIKKIMEEEEIPLIINCYSKPTAWAVSVKITDIGQNGEYFCIDSSGNSKFVQTPTLSTSCPKK